MTRTSTEQTRKKCPNCNGTGSGKDGWDCLNCSGDGWVFAEPAAARTSTEQQEFGTQSKAEYVIEIRNLKRRIAELEKINLSQLDVISNLATEGRKREEKLIELEAEKARLIETYVQCPSATEAYMYGITQEQQG